MCYKDGEVIGIDNGKVIQWDGDKQEVYTSGETIDEFGINNLTDLELVRLNLKNN
jgi:hypothetical protein